MNMIILLTSFSILLVLSMSTTFIFDTDAYAQINQGHGHFHSLKEVLDNMDAGEPLSCPNPEHILVLRPNTNWACVYFETAKHLDWDMVLYSEPNAPQITTSIFYGDEYHNITYQTNEGVVDSVERYSDAGYDNEDDGYILEISITPTQEGDLTVIVPSIESTMFKNYCTEFNGIPDSHYFMYLIDGVEVASEETDTNSESMKVKLHYGVNSKMVEIALACLI